MRFVTRTAPASGKFAQFSVNPMQTRTVLRSVRCSERRPQSRSACRLRRRLARRVARRTTAPGLSPSTSTAPPGDFVIGLPVQKGYRTGTSVPVQRQRGEPGHTRDRLKNLTNHLKTNPTHRLTRQTTHPNPGTHASPHTTHHTTHPIKRECTGNVLFSTDSRDRLQGRSSVGSPAGQLPRGCMYIPSRRARRFVVSTRQR